MNIQIQKCAIRHHLQVINVHKALCKRQKHQLMLKRDGGTSDPGGPGYLCPFGADRSREVQEKLVLEPDITRSQQSKVCTKTIRDYDWAKLATSDMLLLTPEPVSIHTPAPGAPLTLITPIKGLHYLHS